MKNWKKILLGINLSMTISYQMLGQGLISHDFDDGNMGPFVDCTTQSPNYAKVVNNRLRTYWKESSYNSSSRMTKGAEACGDPSYNGIGYLTYKHCWMGFTINIDDAYMGTSYEGVGGLAQIFGFDDADGKSSWTAMLDIEDGDLSWVDRRGQGGTRADLVIYENFPRGVDVDIVIHAVLSGNGNGQVEIFYNGNIIYSAYNIDIGMGEFDSSDTQTNQSYTEFKIGQYNHSSAATNEIRIVDYDNISWYDGVDGYDIVDPSWDSGGVTNVALSGTATQSSTGYLGVASRAIDGDTNGAWSSGSVTHTANEAQPWLQVDLGSSHDIDEIVVWGRTDSCCASRLSNYDVSILDSGSNVVWSNYQSSNPSPSVSIDANGTTGRYVLIELNGTNALSVAELEVFGEESSSGPITNLAENKSVTVSGEQSGNPGSNAVDDNTGTRWSVSGFPQWLEVDLGSVKSISQTELVCFSGRAYQFVVESKTTSGGSYTQIVDRSSNTTGGTEASPITDNFSATDARYVRITVQGASGYTGPWVSQLEFRVFGN